MHAVVVRVSIEGDEQEATQFLRENIVPRVAQLPGLVAGYWFRVEGGNQGRAVIVFESEDAARSASEQVQPSPGVTLDSVEVSEVVASV